MSPSRSWIDRDALRGLVADTAYRPVMPQAPASGSAAATTQPATEQSVDPASAGQPHPSSVEREAVERPVSPPPAVTRPSAATRGASVTVAARPSPRSMGAPSRPASPEHPPPAPEPGIGVPPPPRYEPSEPSLARFSVSTGAPLERRLAELLQWAADVTGLSSCVLVDNEGLVVASRGFNDGVESHAAAVAKLVTLDLAAVVDSHRSGTAVVDVGGQSHVWAWSTTPAGPVVLALHGHVLSAPDVVEQLPRAIDEALV